MTSEEQKKALEILRKPFPPHQISQLPKPFNKDAVKGKCPECGGWHGLPAVHLDFVGHAALTDRLLDADPLWTWEPLALNAEGIPRFDQSGGLWIKLTVGGQTRLGYGHAGDKKGGDAIKEVIGDALRNAAMRFGAALDLWHKGELHVDEEGPEKPSPPRQDPSPDLRKSHPPDAPVGSVDAILEDKPKPMVNNAPQFKNGISEAQGKRLFAIKTKAGWKDFELKDILDRVYNVDHSLKLNKSDYKELTDFMDAGGTSSDLLKQKGM